MFKNLLFILFFVASVVRSQLPTLVYDYNQVVTTCGRTPQVGTLRDTAVHVHCHLKRYGAQTATLTRDCAGSKKNRRKTCAARDGAILHAYAGMDPTVVNYVEFRREFAFCKHKRVSTGLATAGVPTYVDTRGNTRWIVHDFDEDFSGYDTNDPNVQICDEYPFASSAEGGAKTKYSLLCVSKLEGDIQGHMNGRFYEGKNPNDCSPGIISTPVLDTHKYTIAVANIPANIDCANYDVYYQP